jgi:hypothetical protein
MSQLSCEPLIEAIQKLTQELDIIEAQLYALEVEGMNQLHPWRYFALQPQVDRLNRKKLGLQDAWNRAMNELAICRSGQPSPHHP